MTSKPVKRGGRESGDGTETRTEGTKAPQERVPGPLRHSAAANPAALSDEELRAREDIIAMTGSRGDFLKLLMSMRKRIRALEAELAVTKASLEWIFAKEAKHDR